MPACYCEVCPTCKERTVCGECLRCARCGDHKEGCVGCQGEHQEPPETRRMSLIDEFKIPNIDDAFPSDEDLAILGSHLRALADYCKRKSSAQRFRREGLIAEAEGYEAGLERLYRSLPENWRW